MGLRERKKEQTRRLIADTAWRLFADHGFDQVSIARVAQEAEVSPATVFNYFPTKEDLFYSGLDVYAAQLVEAVRARPAGEPVLRAVRRFLDQGDGLLDLVERGDRAALDQLRTVQRVVAESPDLQAREQQVFARQTAALALAIVESSGPADPVVAAVVANALLGVQRALVELVRQRILSDDRLDALATDVRAASARAFDQLGRGLHDYPAGS